ncbi:hypothetical protein BT93_L0801 [Corymbia citriodora subsp. variegata]|uniref:Uncharacterized protein n=1 Tax=Corymbia citriodora subsp. variegata TaxID=360336 RepID=A0A8T0CRQ4_CORYI|nr:hypothetical protein BT93_L0801 [Corymbia citriodora subsp. variegata]
MHPFTHAPVSSSICHTSTLSRIEWSKSPRAPWRSTRQASRNSGHGSHKIRAGSGSQVTRSWLLNVTGGSAPPPLLGSRSSRTRGPSTLLAACVAVKCGSSMTSRHSLQTGISLRRDIVVRRERTLRRRSRGSELVLGGEREGGEEDIGEKL